MSLLSLQIQVPFANGGMYLGFSVNALGENFLLEEPGGRRNCHCQVSLDTMLTGKGLPTIRVDSHRTFAAEPPAATNCVQNYTGLTGGFGKRCTCVNGNTLTIGLKSYIKVFHFVLVVSCF
jgi:hypothetical protein